MKVFGIGLNKTGTKTLGACLRSLGFNHKSYDEDLVRCYELGDFKQIYMTADRYDSFEDWPWPLLFRELDREYPNSRFILTLRKSPEIWYASLCKHARMTGPTKARQIAYGHSMPEPYKQHHIDLHCRHNSDVISYFSNQKDKLLISCWETDSTWTEICSFLNRPIPDIPFPHLNKSHH